MDKDVAFCDELSDRLLTRLGFEIPDHRTLAAIHRHMTRPHMPRVCRLSNIAKIITALRFDLDNIGAHIGEGLGAIRSEDDGTHIRDLDII